MQNRTKQYGLTIPSKKQSVVETVFNVESDEEEEADSVKFKPMQTNKASLQNSQAKLHQRTRTILDEAMAEDPSIFQYDEVYDQMSGNNSTIDRQRGDDVASAPKQQQARYVNKLMRAANERKLERQLRLDRKARQAVEEEAVEFADKEAFVTSAYKAKMAELKAFTDKRDEEEAREECMDVTKQDGLGGFYRYMLESRSGGGDKVETPVDELDQTNKHESEPSSESVTRSRVIADSRSDLSPLDERSSDDRHYRHRHSPDRDRSRGDHKEVHSSVHSRDRHSSSRRSPQNQSHSNTSGHDHHRSESRKLSSPRHSARKEDHSKASDYDHHRSYSRRRSPHPTSRSDSRHKSSNRSPHDRHRHRRHCERSPDKRDRRVSSSHSHRHSSKSISHRSPANHSRSSRRDQDRSSRDSRHNRSQKHSSRKPSHDHQVSSRERDVPTPPSPPSKSTKSLDVKPNTIKVRARVTTDQGIAAALQRYRERKAAGIRPIIADSDSE